MSVRVGLLTGGGDAPGLNAVIRAFIKHGVTQLGLEVVGVEDAFNGLIESPRRLQHLSPRSCQGLLHRGGTILGTTNRGDPFSFPDGAGGRVNRVTELLKGVQEERLDGLVCIGGDGSQKIALRLMTEHGIPIIGVPKTIDNDLCATDLSFGFQTAVAIATEALDRLHTTAESHDRVLFLEVMGRDAGHIALSAGLAGGADIILLPEIPYSPDRLAQKIISRQRRGRSFSIVVVAEGALPRIKNARQLSATQRLRRGGGAAAIAMSSLSERIDAEMRSVVLGHLQRGGSPSAPDRILATRFGVHAADLVKRGAWGQMVRLSNGLISSVSLEEAVASYRFVDPKGELVRTARAVGVEFGE